MTYFTYRHRRGSRGEDVYAGPTVVGRVTVRSDWRARLRLSTAPVDVYLAIPPDGHPLPRTFATRHDAAEALHDLTTPLELRDEVHQLND
jgi:hypothetical protein